MNVICKDCNKNKECMKKQSIETVGYAFSYCDEYEKVTDEAVSNSIGYKCKIPDELRSHFIGFKYLVNSNDTATTPTNAKDIFDAEDVPEVNFYSVYTSYIPDGYRYSSEYDKLVPDVLDEPNGEPIDSGVFTSDSILKVFDDNDSCESHQNSDKSYRDYNVGASDYSKHKIQPWDIWEEYCLDPWDADIIKRILRNKDGDDPVLDYEKIKHICDKKINMLTQYIK